VRGKWKWECRYGNAREWVTQKPLVLTGALFFQLYKLNSNGCPICRERIDIWYSFIWQNIIAVGLYTHVGPNIAYVVYDIDAVFNAIFFSVMVTFLLILVHDCLHERYDSINMTFALTLLCVSCYSATV